MFWGDAHPLIGLSGEAPLGSELGAVAEAICGRPLSLVPTLNPPVLARCGCCW